MTTTIGDATILLPTRIVRDAVISVRARISHPMLTGLSNDAEGKRIPAHFIDTVTVTYGGEEVARFEWTSGMAKDPYVEFPLRATREGPLTITWKDNKGGNFRQTANVTFTP
ncbi:MAG TPA: thiosulfate oxidation carrier complex protein SoxZ [Gemmatimonadaceae bacterium]